VKLCFTKNLIKYLNYQKANETDTYIKDVDTNYELYELIWKPLETYLRKNSNIHFSPSGLLDRISFPLLTNETGQKLSDRYQLNEYTTLGDFIKKRTQEKAYASTSIATFGGADFDRILNTTLTSSERDTLISQNYQPSLSKTRGEVIDSWTALPGTQRETNQIAKLFDQSNWQTQNYSGAIATETNLKQLSGKSSRILHIATHGFFLPDQRRSRRIQSPTTLGRLFSKKHLPLRAAALMRSGLIFTGANHAWKGGEVPKGVDDGILTAYEIVNLDLRNTELVVLSACDTGLGDIESTEGVFGLQRAFKQAGVDKIIMSLWKIDDDKTVKFMEMFYGYFLNAMPIREAFVQTQREIAKSEAPYYWAGFVLVE